MKDAYYFPHDSNAGDDPKLAAFKKKFGYEGYGLWWAIIELMHQEGGKFKKFPAFYEGLSYVLKVDEGLIKKIFDAVINEFFLFKENKTHIWSQRVKKNIKYREAKKLKKSEAGRIGGLISGKVRSKTKHYFEANEANEAKERKGKERKGKEIKGEERKGGASPPFVSLQEQPKTKDFKNYDPIISERLGKIATKDMIKAVMREMPDDLWWKIEKFLKKTYSSGGNGFVQAQTELIRDRKNE